MTRLLAALLAAFAVLLPVAGQADPADVAAAARGVVRVVIVGTDGERLFPISHGSGFAVTPTRIVTNAHVVREAQLDDTLRISVVPSDGEEASYAEVVAVSPRNDLALLQVTNGLRLPPLTVAGTSPGDGGEVSSVGYPMNVDQAQGLDLADIFQPQPAVKSRGFISGARPSRQFDTVLHTAPIARGNSGGPLLDVCGRVLGVNSFGADSGGADAEFFFAVSTRELLPFLRANEVDPRVNALPCRSLAELDEAERERIEREQAAARQSMAARSEQTRRKRERVQLEAEMAVMDERENAMAFALVLLLVAGGAGATAWQLKKSGAADRNVLIAGGVAAVALIAALALWFTRPGLDAIDRRVNAAMQDDGDAEGEAAAGGDVTGTMLCSLQPERSRVTGEPLQELELTFEEDGCVNGRTQYGFAGGEWSRLFVPNEEDAVSVNTYDPDTRTFRTERYLLSRSAIAKAREERGRYKAPACGSSGAASELGEMQSAVVALLPERPNERLVYACEALSGD